MWPHHLLGKLSGLIVTGALPLAVAHIVAPSVGGAFSVPATNSLAAGLIVQVQAGGARLTGAWVSKSGEQHARRRDRRDDLLRAHGHLSEGQDLRQL